MASSGITFENAQAFEAALKAMPTQSMLKTLVFEASMFAQERATRRPADMGATPGTSGLHSTGNVPTPLRDYYQRGKGTRYVPGMHNRFGIVGQTGRTRRRGKKEVNEKGKTVIVNRSENLKNSWRRERNSDSTVVEVLTEVSYAGRVQGGAGDPHQQTRVMEARGWETIDDVAKAVEDNIGKVMRNTVGRLYQQWFAKYGITSTTSSS